MKGGGCKDVFKVRLQCACSRMPMLPSCGHLSLGPAAQDPGFSLVSGALQDWSKCVDSERKTGGDFAADCREQVHLRIPQRAAVHESHTKAFVPLMT